MLLEQENIHGGMGCEIPGGGRCTACCYLFEVRNSAGILITPATTECRACKIGTGCLIHNEEKLLPLACKRFHCSKLIIELKDPRSRDQAYFRLNMLNLSALQRGEITQEQYKNNQERIMTLNNIK